MATRVKFVLFCCIFLLISPLFAGATRQSRAFAAATRQSAVKRETIAEWMARREIEADKLLAMVNRPYVKSFTSPYGDIVDCVRFEDQLSLADPLMKNHTIQMRPMWKPEDKPGKVFEMPGEHMILDHHNDGDGCTYGTIPIIRTLKETVLNFDPIESFGRKKYPSNAALRFPHAELYKRRQARVNISHNRQ